MKKIFLIFLILLIASCAKNPSYKGVRKMVKKDTIYSKHEAPIEEYIFPEHEYSKHEPPLEEYELQLAENEVIVIENGIEIYEEIVEISYSIHEEEILDTVIIYEDAGYGDINYIVEDTMLIGETKIVNMTISEAVERDIIIAEVEMFTEENTFTETIRIAPVMRAKLIDPTNENFTIIPITPEEQLIENNEFTKWEWSVTPLTKGDNKLKLTVDVIYDDISKNVKVYEDFIYVYSDESIFDKILSFIYDEWKWFLSTLLIPLIIFFYKKRKSKKNI